MKLSVCESEYDLIWGRAISIQSQINTALSSHHIIPIFMHLFIWFLSHTKNMIVLMVYSWLWAQRWLLVWLREPYEVFWIEHCWLCTKKMTFLLFYLFSHSWFPLKINYKENIISFYSWNDKNINKFYKVGLWY